MGASHLFVYFLGTVFVYSYIRVAFKQDLTIIIMEKIDPYKHKEKYEAWKEKVKNGIPGINKLNSDMILQYLSDMEMGLNVANTNKKGSRSYSRLSSLKFRMIFLAKGFEKRCKKSLLELSEKELFELFLEMRQGKITRKDGKTYLSTADYAKNFRAFWHWWQKVNKKENKEIPDITADLDTSYDKPKWVYLTEEQIRKLCDNAKYDYKVLMTFLFDSGIRAPTELMNVAVSDLYNDENGKLVLQIRDEVSKTFGRKLKLMVSSQLIKEYIKNKGLKQGDYLFPINPPIVNKYLQRLAIRILGDRVSEAGKKYSQLTMYDFRHCSCCYWLPRYKSEAALKYRFGWKRSEKIHYYSEFLGMKDTITEEDMLIDITKTEIEKRLTKTERENEILKERLKVSESKWEEVSALVNEMYENTKYKYPKKELVHSEKTSIFYQDKQPIALNKLKRDFGVVEVEV